MSISIHDVTQSSGAMHQFGNIWSSLNKVIKPCGHPIKKEDQTGGSSVHYGLALRRESEKTKRRRQCRGVISRSLNQSSISISKKPEPLWA